MTIHERIRALNTLSSTQFKHLMNGYTIIANDLTLTLDDRQKARDRLQLLRLSRLPAATRASTLPPVLLKGDPPLS